MPLLGEPLATQIDNILDAITLTARWLLDHWWVVLLFLFSLWLFHCCCMFCCQLNLNETLCCCFCCCYLCGCCSNDEECGCIPLWGNNFNTQRPFNGGGYTEIIEI
uniref:Uncharacterized protein n=1 Tax=Globodera rostochiensis TaxID=31243 RepID=A0A914I080_GLORO